MKNKDVGRECNTNGINTKSHTISNENLSPDLRVNGNVILKYLLHIWVCCCRHDSPD
jgi:hypothetical protein